ncbi:MAG TPA: hypothetical protein VLB67_08770 [Acidimicrobiia bacterium]|nr:hypothetical protein [Acidimicrobiia bacterium]
MSRLVPALLLLAACAPNTESPTTVTTAPTTTTTSIPSVAEAEEAFVRCVADGGIALPDVTDSDLPLLDRLAPHLDLGDPSVRQVVVDCSPILLLAGAIQFDPEVAELVEANLAAFSECMRAEGVIEFPDPVGDRSWPLAEIPFDDAGFEDALDACVAGLMVDP